MAKRTVKLTESELKQIITESVKNIISELDWKTYANAAKKTHLKALDGDVSGDEYHKLLKKSNNFSKAANNAFDRDYGIDNGSLYTKLDNSRHGSNTPAPGGGYFPYQDDTKLKTYDRTEKTAWGYDYPMDDYEIERMYKWNKDDEFTQKHKAANKEIQDYKKGNYDYTKGKGWHLKDK